MRSGQLDGPGSVHAVAQQLIAEHGREHACSVTVPGDLGDRPRPVPGFREPVHEPGDALQSQQALPFVVEPGGTAAAARAAKSVATPGGETKTWVRAMTIPTLARSRSSSSNV